MSDTFFWHDPLGRLHAAGDYGTLWDGPRPRAVRQSAREAHFVTTLYNARGEACRARDKDWLKDTRGEHLSEFDDAGRVVRTVRNVNSDKQRLETKIKYRPDDQVETLTVNNAHTGGQQVTRYEYQTDLESSDILARNLRTAVVAPDGARTSFDYNRQGEVKRMTDPNGTAHGYSFDALGRVRVDDVECFGKGISQHVKTIKYEFDEFGRMFQVSSHGSNGEALNQVVRGYGDFGALLSEAQGHRGAPQLTEKVHYTYESSRGQQQRLREIHYPSIIYSDSENEDPNNKKIHPDAGRVSRRVRFGYDTLPNETEKKQKKDRHF